MARFGSRISSCRCASQSGRTRICGPGSFVSFPLKRNLPIVTGSSINLRWECRPSRNASSKSVVTPPGHPFREPCSLRPAEEHHARQRPFARELSARPLARDAGHLDEDMTLHNFYLEDLKIVGYGRAKPFARSDIESASMKRTFDRAILQPPFREARVLMGADVVGRAKLIAWKVIERDFAITDSDGRDASFDHPIDPCNHQPVVVRQ